MEYITWCTAMSYNASKAIALGKKAVRHIRKQLQQLLSQSDFNFDGKREKFSSSMAEELAKRCF